VRVFFCVPVVLVGVPEEPLEAGGWKLEAGSWKLEARAVGATAGYVEGLFVGWVELAIPMLPG
jgi:hypothetical protein